ncbi:MAG: DUF4340 domain-containing protein [Chloroflexota bacterium]
MKRSTWIVLFVFLALVGLMVYLDQKETPTDETAATTPTVPPEKLFNETDGTPTSIEIASQDGRTVKLAHNEAGLWTLEKPIEAEADQGAAEAAATQVASLRILSKPEVAPADAGLVSPSFSLTVKTSSGAEKDIRIGDTTPTGSGYYAQEAGSEAVIILDKTGIDVLLGLLASPPYLNTPTPSPTPAPPTETPTPLPETQATPTSAP